MNAKLILEDGREINVTVNEDVIATVDESKHGLEEPENGDVYFDIFGYECRYKNSCNNEEYSQGLISTNKKLQQDRIRARKIKFALEKFAAEHNEPIDWKDGNIEKYHLYYDYDYNTICIYDNLCYKHEGITYFSSRETAEQAILALNEDGELTWYMCDYQPYIGCFKG